MTDTIPNFNLAEISKRIVALEAEVQSELVAARQAAKNERSTARKTADSEYVAAEKAAKDKYRSRSKEVAELLWSVKQHCPDRLDAVCKKAKIGRSRKFELIKIGRGEKTLEDSRREDAERHKKSRATKAAKKKIGTKPAPEAEAVHDGGAVMDSSPKEAAAPKEPGDEQPTEEPIEEPPTAPAVPTSAERVALLASSLISWFPDDVADALMARNRSYAVALANAILARSPSPPPPVLADDGLPEIVTTEDLAARRAEEEARLELPANLRRTVEPALEQVEHIADAKVEVLVPEASAPAKSKRKSRSKNTAPVTPDPAEPHPTIQ